LGFEAGIVQQRGTRPQNRPAQNQAEPAGPLNPAEILANIKAISERLHVAEDLKVPELAMRANELRIRRIMQVRSEKQPPDYLIVELEDRSGNLVASVALTPAGVFMGAEDCRQCAPGSRSLDLSVASRRVLDRRGRAPRAAEYVYFDNVIERGYSRFRPLVAVTTERGTLYLNSRSEAFVEEGSAILDEFGGPARSRAVLAPPGFRQFRSVCLW
jgi:hypothetical protein